MGVTRFTALLPRSGDSDIDDYVEAIEYTMKVCGEDSVGIGTDMVQDQPDWLTEWCCRDKGYARLLTDYGVVKELGGLERHRMLPNLTGGLERRGWPPRRIEKVMGENWMTFLKEVWGA